MSNWFFNPSPINNAAYHLFCFPYAGGNAAVYLPWRKLLAENIDLIAIQYPGRANRFNEELISDMEVAVNQIVELILQNYADKKLLFFGHSLGGRLAYEVAISLQKNGINLELFMPSGIKAPHIEADKNTPFYQRELIRGGVPIDKLCDKDFIEELKFLQGTPEVVLNNSELLQIVMPILRADFRLARGCNEARVFEKLTASIISFSATNDNTVETQEVNQWRAITSNSYDHYEYSGDHFFINAYQQSLVNVIHEYVSKN